VKSARLGALGSIGLGAAGLLAFLLIWEAVPALGLVNPMMLPGPLAIPAAFRSELASGMWLSAVTGSLGHYFTGADHRLGAGCGARRARRHVACIAEEATAWVCACCGRFPASPGCPSPSSGLASTPKAAVFIIAIGVFWIVFFAAQGAVRGVDRDLIEVADAFGFRTPWQRLFKILLPAAMPGILVGLRTALGQAWMAVVAAEIFGVAGSASA
jgi:sulfonate transport system permease protein